MRKDWQGPDHMEGAVQGTVQKSPGNCVSVDWSQDPTRDGPAQLKGHTDWEMRCPQPGAEDREREREVDLPTQCTTP